MIPGLTDEDRNLAPDAISRRKNPHGCADVQAWTAWDRAWLDAWVARKNAAAGYLPPTAIPDEP